MNINQIIESCLPKEADGDWFKNLKYDTKEAFKRRANTDADAYLIYWGYNLCTEHVKSTIPTIVELLIAEIEKMPRRIVKMGVDEQGRRFEVVENTVRLEDIINLLKQK